MIRRILRKSRFVHDIDSALVWQNYDRFDLPETEKKTIEVIKDKNSTEEIHSTNNPQSVLNTGRVFRHNMIRAFVGFKTAKTETDYFLSFITHEMLAGILHHTNKKIDLLLAIFFLISTKISNIHLRRRSFKLN